MLNHVVAHDTAPCFKRGDPNPETLPAMTEAGAGDLTTAYTIAGLFADLHLAGAGGLELQPLVPETSALVIELRPCRKEPAATRRSSGYSMYRLRWSPEVSLAATRPIPFGGHELGINRRLASCNFHYVQTRLTLSLFVPSAAVRPSRDVALNDIPVAVRPGSVEYNISMTTCYVDAAKRRRQNPGDNPWLG